MTMTPKVLQNIYKNVVAFFLDNSIIRGEVIKI